MEKLNCIIADDDEIDRLTALSFVKKFPHFNILGVCSNADEVLNIIENNTIDVLFLDIDMPGTSGIELRKKIENVPVCVFITAYAEHAAESFDLDTLDFIVKPINYERFERTANRILQFFEIRDKANLFESSIGGDSVYIKDGHTQIKIKMHDILYLEALKDYTLIVTPQKKHCVLSGIGTLLKHESFNTFLRIHKSYAVQKFFVDQFSTVEVLLKNGTNLPVGRSYKDNLQFIL